MIARVPQPLCVLASLAFLSGCTLLRPAPPFTPGPGRPAAAAPGPGSAAPPAGIAAPGVSQAAPEPGEHAPSAPPRQFHLSPASAALIAQAHAQAAGGDPGQAAITLERAVRIEPDNPLPWIELGRVRLQENNPAQADSMGRKALSLATGDAAAQSQSWHLIADALRAGGRNGEAAEAEARAQGLSPH